METQTSTETGSRRNGRAGSNGVQASSRGDQGASSSGFDSGPAAAAASAGFSGPAGRVRRLGDRDRKSPR